MTGDETIKEYRESRDLLRRFIGRNNFIEKNEIRKEEEEDIQLTLGLSSNGRFGVDLKTTNNLTRSSSISNFMISSEGSGICLDGVLTRTCSLPADTEDWRKRKELQSKRRMEAKRKRLEKMKNGRVTRKRLYSKQICDENGKVETKGETAPQASIALTSQGSGGSSCVPEIQPTGFTGTNTACLPREVEQKALPTHGSITDKSGGAVAENSSPNKVKVGQQNGVKSMMDMPYVTTTGDGPNGRRIEGLLYRYKKAEEVKIVCVCHGSFFSPAEFVKHAGGGDVANPLRQIVVCDAPF